jgi:ABC-2 type transport system ATP-binding protein
MTSPAIETIHLTRRFGKRTAVNDLNLEAPPGSIYGFLGPNGAGKTTTIRMLLGLIRADAGEIRVLGQSLKENRLGLLRRIGALVETPSLYPHLTGYENLEVIRRLVAVKRANIDRVLQIVSLTADAHRLVREYSLGMKQRLGIALALLAEPELLILDEPTNGLDPAGIREMRALLRNLATQQNLTIFLSSHLLNEVEQVATHIGVIQEGQLRYQGSLADLQAQRQEMVNLKVDRTEDAARLLQQAGWATQLAEDPLRLSVHAQHHQEAAQINRLLVEAGLQVFHLSLEQSTLEDMFMKLTRSETAERMTAEC